MEIKKFIHKMHLKKLNKQCAGKKMLIKTTAFVPKHMIAAGRNRASTVLSLTEKYIEASEVFFYKDISPRVYYYSYVTEGQKGFNKDNNYLIILKKNGKDTALHLQDKWEMSDIDVTCLQVAFGYTIDNKTYEETKEYYKDLVRMFSKEEVISLAEQCGFDVIKIMQFTGIVYLFNLQFVNCESLKLHIGGRINNTYNSLPYTVEIQEMKKVKTIGLAEIGIESAGYYDHSDRMQVLKEELSRVKKFQEQFNRKTG